MFQVISKPVGDASRSRVRMGGRWALPTSRSHREVVQLLREGRLRLGKETCERPTTVTPELLTSQGPMLPLLVTHGEQMSVAVEGRAYVAGTVIVGLVPAEGTADVGGHQEVAEPPRET